MSLEIKVKKISIKTTIFVHIRISTGVVQSSEVSETRRIALYTFTHGLGNHVNQEIDGLNLSGAFDKPCLSRELVDPFKA